MKLRLRNWRKEDIASLAILANNKNIFDNMRDHFPHPYTLKDAEEWIAMNENRNPPTNFAIEVDGKLAGGCGMMIFGDVYRRSAEIGYWIGEPFWRRGIATEAVKLLLEKIKIDFPEIIRVSAEIFEHNKASMKVLEKNGFHLESIRQKVVIKNDIIMNDHVWVKLLDK